MLGGLPFDLREIKPTTMTKTKQVYQHPCVQSKRLFSPLLSSLLKAKASHGLLVSLQGYTRLSSGTLCQSADRPLAVHEGHYLDCARFARTKGSGNRHGSQLSLRGWDSSRTRMNTNHFKSTRERPSQHVPGLRIRHKYFPVHKIRHMDLQLYM